MNRSRFLLMLTLVFALMLSAFAVSAQDDATPIGYGDTIDSDLTSDNPDRFYTFEASAGDQIEINLMADFDTYLFLFDSAGEEIERDDDGGDGLQSRILGFEIPADDTYTIRATSFGYRDEDPERITIGDITLSLNLIDITPVDINSSVTASLNTDEARTLYFGFTANDGDVLDIIVDSEGFLDTRLVVFGPFGFEVGENDDAGESVDPALFEFPLNSTGDYLLVVEPQNANARLSGDLTVIVGTAELASLDSGDFAVSLNNDRDQVVTTFEAEAGEVVSLTMEVNFRTDFGSPAIEVTQGDDTIASARSLSGVDFITFTFTVPEAGSVNVNVSSFSDFEAVLSLGRMDAEEE